MPDFPLRLGYLVVDARSTSDWSRFCAQVLALSGPVANCDGSLGWQVDGSVQRLIVQPGDSDDLQAIGLEARDDRALDGCVAALREAGHEVRDADEKRTWARRVRRLHVAVDPAGTEVELFCGLEAARESFASAGYPRGFVTGDLGMGHVALAHGDLDAMEAFYGALGFGVTERLRTKVGPLQVEGIFLHCNRRHHTIAVLGLPSTKRMHHFMLQAAEHMDVGRAFERAQRLGVPLSLSLGQHPDPDGTFSFYASTPSGFDFEIGAGSKAIEPLGRSVDHTTQTSTWGHEPNWRLKLRLVRALLTRRRPAPALRAG